MVQAALVLGFVWSHPANRSRRLRGVARAVGFQVRGRLGRPTVTTIGDRGRMQVWLHDTAATKALYANPPDWNEMVAWRRLLRPGELFVDVGSNVGSYAFWAADAGAEVSRAGPRQRSCARTSRSTTSPSRCGNAPSPPNLGGCGSPATWVRPTIWSPHRRR